MGNRKWQINVFYLINILSLDPGSAVILQYIQTRKSISLNLFWKIVSRLFDRHERQLLFSSLKCCKKTNYFPGWNVARKTHQIIVWSKPFTFARGKVRSVVAGWWKLLVFFLNFFFHLCLRAVPLRARVMETFGIFLLFSFFFHFSPLGESLFHSKMMDTFEQNQFLWAALDCLIQSTCFVSFNLCICICIFVFVGCVS